MPDVTPFYAISIAKQAYARQTQGLPAYHMEFGQPTAGAPKAAIAAAHRVLDRDSMGYWESPSLKSRLAQHYHSFYGVEITPQRIPITMGASTALTLALNILFAPGDHIALARPGYPCHRNTMHALHLVPQEIACGPDTRFQITAAHIAALNPAPRGLLIASPANPTGSMIDFAELQKIVEICRERNIILLSDEIYHQLTYAERAHSILELTQDAIVINSFSKYYCMAGWRLGWLVVPEKLATCFDTYIGNLFLTPPSLAQHAALEALDAKAELDENILTYRANRELLLAELPKLGITHIAPPDGAFYIYADVGHLTNDSLSFCHELVAATGVALAPGIDFDPVEGKRFLRLSFAIATEELRVALAVFADFIKR